MRKQWAFWAMLVSLGGIVGAEEPRKVYVGDALPFDQPPIDYWSADSQDPVAELNRRLEKEQVGLEFSERFGYLPAVLKALDVPVSSQLLRFQSGGLQRNISRQRPRAFYFNDDVVVASSAQAEQLELAAQDADKGTLFYTLKNRADAPPRFERSQKMVCLACHNSDGWHHSNIGAPGHIVASGVTIEEARRFPLGGVVTHAMPIEFRWAGQYVSGLERRQKHRGVTIDLKPEDEFESHQYLLGTSDAVAHLVSDHQMFGQHLLSRLSYEHQLHVRSKVELMTVRYLLLADEAPFDHPISGKSEYADWYQARGPKDANGRSLYDLDLKRRTFRYRISPLLQSRMVQGFPPELKTALFRRLNDTLTGREALKGYSISDEDRSATLSVLRATVRDWPME
ncbi:MAG TPA: hypothetical protein VHB77_18495 [Planctomycetaceae bacterium]|nr:hypothetical protein [Planctomycetaceae bacterium]